VSFRFAGKKSMNRITVDDVLKSRLDGAVEPVEVCDLDGQMLGHFVPIAALESRDGCPYSTDELNRMHAEDGGRSLAEIWKSLGAK
jgi:hypothetical protein